MGDVVCHLVDNGKCFVSGCGSDRYVKGNATTNKKYVTCPDCLGLLGVKPEVDEEKVEFAKAIYMDDIFDDCRYCHKNSSCDHDEDCIVPKAEAYLKSVKGE